MSIKPSHPLQTSVALFLIAFIVLTFHKSAQADCPFKLPHEPSKAKDLDLDQAGALTFTKDVRVINVYWGGNNWNGIQAHKPTSAILYGFQKEDIDRATRALFSTDYFLKLCQYGGPSGGPRVVLLASTDTGQELNPCLPHVPQNNFTTADIFQFVSCEENFPFTDIPHSNGIPTELTPGVTGGACSLCGLTAQPCYLDGACLAFPNSTGDLIINVIPPKDRHFADPQNCPTTSASGMDGFHFQIPSNAFGYPLTPLLLTQARPIYFTFVRTECFATIDQLMGTLSHELVEALSDPMPGSFWYDNSQGKTGANGEAADICDGKTSAGLDWQDGTGVTHTMRVAFWWSNYDHQCVASLKIPNPGPPIDRCASIQAAIERLKERIRQLEEEMGNATGQERSLLQSKIKAANQQLKTEEQALSQCRT